MAKKQEQVNEIVENEPVVINEKDIISGEEVKETDVIDVNAPEVIIEEKNKAEEETKAKAVDEEKAKVEKEAKAEEDAKKAEEEAKAKAEAEEKAKKEADAKSTKVKLKILVAFTDKYNGKYYEANDEITVDPARAEELLSDERKLVEKVN